MDLLFREATALGASLILPILAGRSTFKIPHGQVLRKMKHWESIAIATCKQSGQAFLPKILAPQSLDKYLLQTASEPNVLLVATLAKEAEPLWDALETVASHRVMTSLVLFIGPEGDFTFEEYQELAKRGAHGVRLSHQTMRAETASSYALSVIDQWLQRYERRSHR
jgi:16S rRNA (uracil1498-N3)-methyltransferase